MRAASSHQDIESKGIFISTFEADTEHKVALCRASRPSPVQYSKYTFQRQFQAGYFKAFMLKAASSLPVSFTYIYMYSCFLFYWPSVHRDLFSPFDKIMRKWSHCQPPPFDFVPLAFHKAFSTVFNNKYP